MLYWHLIYNLKLRPVNPDESIWCEQTIQKQNLHYSKPHFKLKVNLRKDAVGNQLTFNKHGERTVDQQVNQCRSRTQLNRVEEQRDPGLQMNTS